jgi:acetyl/propionyl-CoA carboxylase alpha subunit
MGDELAAKRLMAAAGVPTLDAVEVGKLAAARKAARDIGYPILAQGVGRRGRARHARRSLPKAGSRGVGYRERPARGGRGLRRRHRSSPNAGLKRPHRSRSRYSGIEGAILVHCFERERSIQRRHQKIIEEAPSPTLDGDVRVAMCEAAVSAARKLGLFVRRGRLQSLPVSGREFGSLEVNARLQVQHILSLRRSSARIWFASRSGSLRGRRSLSVRRISRSGGHAIEARSAAPKIPRTDFPPSPGPVLLWRPFRGGGGACSTVELRPAAWSVRISTP